MVRFRMEIIFVVGFWWLWDILSTSLTNLVCPKSLTILPLECLDLLTLKIGTGKGLTCGPSFVKKCHSVGNSPQRIQ
jgi:hypothetical protein